MDAESLKGHLDLMLLASVKAEPLHGYGIVQRVRLLSDGAFDLPEGTIYPALHRLERRGLLSSGWQTAAGRRRRVYTLTPDGERALGERREAWQRFAAGVSAVLDGS